MAAAGPSLSPAHRRRLREVWRSAGWPCHDMIELDLLVAGLLTPERDSAGREHLRLSPAGLQTLAASRAGHRAARDPHETLVDRVALDMHRAGRVVWCGLSLRAPVALLPDPAAKPDSPDQAPAAAPGATAEPAQRPRHAPTLWAAEDEAAWPPAGDARPAAAGQRWALAMPDVFSVRHTTREDLVLPVVHEIKVQRSDLLADLKRPAKGEAYRAISSECWYVLKAGIGGPEDVPEAYGVMRAHPLSGQPSGSGFGVLEVLRPAPRRPFVLPFALWMALARAAPRRFEEGDEAQGLLGDAGGPSGPDAPRG